MQLRRSDARLGLNRLAFDRLLMVDIVIGYMRIQVGRLDALSVDACQALAVVLCSHWVLGDFHVII